MTDVPFFSLARAHAELRPQLDAAIARVIDSNRLIMGRELSAFEQAFAEACGVRHAIGTGNGLDAISLILRALGIGAGDEVIVPGRAVEDSEYRFFWLRRVFSSLSLVKVVRVNCERALPTELPQQRDPAGSVACPPAN